MKCYDVPSNVFAKFTIRFARRPRHGQGEVKEGERRGGKASLSWLSEGQKKMFFLEILSSLCQIDWNLL